MKSYFGKIKSYIIVHKIISVIILIVIVGTGYYGYKKATSTAGEVRYVTALASKATIISSVSASGQVETSNEIDLKLRASGTITYVGIKAGDTVKKGKTLFSLDTRDAQKAVRNAETSLETAQLELDKFEQPPDSVAVMQVKKAIADAEASKLDAKQAIKDSYRKLLNTSTAAAPGTPSTQTPPTISGTYIKDQEAIITIHVSSAGSGGYFSATSEPVGIVTGYGDVSTITAQPLGDSGLYIKFASNSGNQPDWIITLPNKLGSSYYADNTAYQNAINNEKKVDDTADLTIAQNNKSLSDLYTPDALTLRSKQLAVTQAQDVLTDAKDALSDYYVVAPFDGVIASVTGKVGDTASGTLGSIVTDQKIAALSMNEVDVAKVKLGQKATITFDAIDGLSITGEVSEIDTVGTVSQGVVSYKVKITFDIDDARIKSGMTVSANIQSDVHTDVLSIPSSAVKTVNGVSVVQAFDPAIADGGTAGTISATPPKQIEVTTGISDDSRIEIISGLNEGEQVVARTVTNTTAAKTTTPAARGGFGGGGLRL